MMTDLTGQQFGNYRLIRLLGSGGFASVYLGQHVRIASQQAAIKVLHLFGVDAQAFQQEAETTASLDHPNIVRLLDFDLHQGTMPFLVMYYASNGSLRTRHPKGTRLPLSTVIQYANELASALQYAHDSNIIHRDIKPENILIGRRNELLLGDFGIAVLSKTGHTSLERGYNIGGTAEYMAPEMFRGKPEKASDQYSLGIVVYEWLCGTPPFTEGNPIQLGFQHTHEEVPSIREKLSSLPSSIEAVVMRALAKDPKNRFPSIQDFVDALAEASQARPVVVRAPSPIILPPTPAKPAPSIGTRLLTYQGHTSSVLKLAWSPDGTRIASSSVDKTAQVWNANNGSLVLTYIGHTDAVYQIAWSPDGKKIVSGSADKSVQIWNPVQVWGPNSAQRLLTYSGHTNAVGWVTWSPDGTYVASGSDDKTVQVWNTTDGRLLHKYAGHTDRVYGVAWSPAGTLVASGSADKTVHVWHARSGQLLHKYTSLTDRIVSVVWSPNGMYLAASSMDGTIWVWDASKNQLVRKYVGHTSYVLDIAWSPDGTRLASGSNDKTVHVWKAESGLLLYKYTGHTNTVMGVSWSPDSTRIASCSLDNTAQVWRAV